MKRYCSTDSSETRLSRGTLRTESFSARHAEKIVKYVRRMLKSRESGFIAVHVHHRRLVVSVRHDDQTSSAVASAKKL